MLFRSIAVVVGSGVEPVCAAVAEVATSKAVAVVRPWIPVPEAVADRAVAVRKLP